MEERGCSGFELGFPVVWVPSLDANDAATLVSYLLDGSYIDDRTRVLRLHLLSLNPDAEVFGCDTVPLGPSLQMSL